MTKLDLSAIEGRLEKAKEAVPGRWYPAEPYRDVLSDSGARVILVASNMKPEHAKALVTHVAEAPSDIAALIAAVRERDAEIAKLQALVADFVAAEDMPVPPLGTPESLPAFDAYRTAFQGAVARARAALASGGA